ncbi:MAG: YggS family pyridoxal phosphate-dependent enzyme [Bacteroidota bacterium]
MSVLQQLQSTLAPSQTQLVAVSKTKPAEQILALYEEGQRLFGENRVQELRWKYEELPKDIEWHLIGQLQSNKVKYIAPFVAMIHSIDSVKLIREVNKQGAKSERVVPILLQFKIAEEDTKAGFEWSTIEAFLAENDLQAFPHVRICGVMGMATFTDDMQQVRREFKQLKQYFDRLKEQYFAAEDSFQEISMGMSGDYRIAIEEGSTMVRIGSLLFGAR